MFHLHMINIVPNGVGAFGTAFKRFTEYVGHVSPHFQPDVIEKYAMLGTAYSQTCSNKLN